MHDSAEGAAGVARRPPPLALLPARTAVLVGKGLLASHRQFAIHAIPRLSLDGLLGYHLYFVLKTCGLNGSVRGDRGAGAKSSGWEPGSDEQP